MPATAYARLRKVHTGTRFSVFRACSQAGQRVVIKQALAEQAEQDAARLEHEYELLRSLDLHGVPRALELTILEGRAALVLEDKGPRNLGELLGGRPLASEPFLELAIGMAEIVRRLHARGVIHRDICPDNFVVGDDAHAIALVDFDAATAVPAFAPAPALAGELEGTLPYMAPEQTGRMKRTVDRRADLYALGATFYEMLTGRPPFAGQGALELVHAHAARAPVAPALLNPAVPQGVSQLVLKLLAKMPEWRYQSADALVDDLVNAQRTLRARGDVPEFDLGQRDLPYGFLLAPEQLYGRERARAAIEDAMERAAAGRAEVVLVSGPAGIGKSALVNQVQGRPASQRFRWITAKGDLLRENAPYAAVIDGLRRLVQELLALPDQERALLRDRLQAAVAPNGRVLTDAVPELSALLGEQPSVPAVGAVENENRFRLTLIAFLRALGADGRPLCLFVDDLHWVDAGSLGLLSALVAAPELPALLVIGAYRADDVAPDHPVSRTIAKIREAGARITTLELGPLGREALAELLRDALRWAPREAEQFAEVISRKTAGNPFFARQFLGYLYRRQVLSWDAAQGRWVIDLAAAEAADVTLNVVDLLVDQLEDLPIEARYALTTAACIGSRFELVVLAGVRGEPIDATAQALWKPIEQGLLVAVADRSAYSFAARKPVELGTALSPIYRFVHDRIQQAAYGLLPEEERKLLHLQIAEWLKANVPGEALERAPFVLADQLSRAADLLPAGERIELARLDAQAGRSARAAGAFASALGYFQSGLAALPDQSRRGELHALWFELHRGAAECAGLTGELELAERLVDEGVARTSARLEQVELYTISVRANALRGRHAQSLERGRQGLRLLGIELPEHLPSELLAREKERALAALRRRSNRELLEASAPIDPIDRAKLQLLVGLTSAWFEAPELFKVVGYRAAEIAAAHGRVPGAAVALAYVGAALAMDGDYPAAQRYGELAVQLAERSGNPADEATALLSLGSFAGPWRSPIGQVVPLLERSYARGLESGALETAAFAATTEVIARSCAGDPLDRVLVHASRAQRFDRAVHYVPGALHVQALIQAVKCLNGQTRGPTSFDDADFSEAEFIASAGRDEFARLLLAMLKTATSYVLGEREAARASARQLVPAGHVIMMFLRADCSFYGALALVGAPARTGATRPADSVLTQAREHLARLEEYAKCAPMNWAHKHALAAAELARVEQRGAEAIALYHEAIEGAGRAGFVQDEALAHELCGLFHHGRGAERLATLHLQAARDGYARWGARAKLEQLGRQFPALGPPAGALRQPAAGRSPALDYLSLLKTAEALGEGLVFDRLLEPLARASLEAAAAERAALVLDEGGLVLRATASTAHDVILERRPLAASQSLPRSVIEHVFWTRETVLLGDAQRDARFGRDPSLAERGVRSVLAVPIVRADRALGVLYFENNLASDAFTEQRADMLRLLAVELAIALENGRLLQQRDERERYLRLVFRHLPGVVWATDDRLRFTYVNGRLIDDAGIASDRLIGSTVHDFFGTTSPTEPAVAHHLAALAGERQAFDYRFRERWFSVLMDPLRDADGRVVGCVGVAFDVTDKRVAEERLARSEAQLSEAQRVAHIGSFEWDAQTNAVTWSEELHRIYGLAPGEFRGTIDTFLGRVHPDDVAAIRKAVFDAYWARQPFAYDHRIVRADGQTRVVHTRGDVITDARGQPVRVVGTSWDVTEMTEAAQARERLLSLVRATLEATADGILVVDRERKVTLYNSRFLKLCGIPDELAEQRDEQALMAHVGEQLEDEEAFRRGLRERYENPAVESTDLLRFKDGRVLERFSRPQRIGDDIAGTVWSYRDISEREHLLRRALFLADATRLLASLDLEQALEALARLAVPYLGDYCAIDLLGDGEPKRFSAAAHGMAPPSDFALHRSVLAGHGLIYPRGSLSCLGVPILIRGRMLGAITLLAGSDRRFTTRDLDLAEELSRRTALAIENVRLYRGARDALRARDEFLSIAAHEIRGPLNAIHLSVQSIRQHAVPDSAVPQLLEVVERQDRRLSRFVDELLDLARIRSGRFQLELSDVNLVQVVREVATQLGPELARSGSPLTVVAEGPITGQWDRSRLEQVVTNLLTNAIKFGLGRPIEITVSAWGGQARLAVRDHGIGIAPEAQQRIFSPFERGVSVRHYGGLGLGLHIVKTIVDALGGTIGVESTPGKGSTFVVELPRERAASADEAWLVH